MTVRNLPLSIDYRLPCESARWTFRSGHAICARSAAQLPGDCLRIPNDPLGYELLDQSAGARSSGKPRAATLDSQRRSARCECGRVDRVPLWSTVRIRHRVRCRDHRPLPAFHFGSRQGFGSVVQGIGTEARIPDRLHDCSDRPVRRRPRRNLQCSRLSPLSGNRPENRLSGIYQGGQSSGCLRLPVTADGSCYASLRCSQSVSPFPLPWPD